MYIWPCLILQAYTTEHKAKQYNIKNGLFYEIVEITENIIKFKNSNDELMQLSNLEIPQKMLLCYAYTYHKSQARTIKGTLRLAQTNHNNFSQRHLIVGLGRAPRGIDVQVA